ncbi:hypothetical protein KA344_08070, partial [bacterium]|nr:hypothetical protein [bacterium]
AFVHMISNERYELERMTKVQRFFYDRMSEQDQASYERMSSYETNLYKRFDTQRLLDFPSTASGECQEFGQEG